MTITKSNMVRLVDSDGAIAVCQLDELCAMNELDLAEAIEALETAGEWRFSAGIDDEYRVTPA